MKSVSAPMTSLAQPRIPRVTRLMAIAVKFQDMVDLGKLRDYADIARSGPVSRARIVQIMHLSNLAPEIQEQLLFPVGFLPRSGGCGRLCRRFNGGPSGTCGPS